jgi:hypothetical protein
MRRGPFVCIAAGPASAPASPAGGGREHDGRRGHRPGRGLRGADVHAGPDRVRPAGCRLGLGQHARVVDQLAERFPAAAGLLADAAADLLAFTAFLKEHWRQTWVQSPQERLNGELAERVYRPEVCSCSKITSGPG